MAATPFQPDSRAHDALTQWSAVSVRPARRQVAAANGQVGRSTQTNGRDPIKPEGRMSEGRMKPEIQRSKPDLPARAQQGGGRMTGEDGLQAALLAGEP
jgi:hypothetical protein